MTIRSFCAVTILGALLSGCAGIPRYESGSRVEWADEAGSVTVAHLATLRWEDAAPLLQPKFPMTSEAALATALPTTQTLDERLADILTANLQVSLPTTTKTRTATESGPAGSTEKSVQNVTTDKSGDTSGIAAAALPAATAATLNGLSSGIGTVQDPMLRHLAATALFQEVNLLNRYVSDAVRYRGAQAFLVRLQISVLPSRRALPYDVTTDITVHADDVQAHAGLAAPSFNAVVAEKNALMSNQPASAADLPEAGEGRCGARWDTVNVVPLVVTDNLESLAAARASDTVRQLGLALLATAGNVGAAGQFARTREALRRVEGHDTNSLLTVARLTDDTVRVRLGAALSPRYGNVMLPRTHNISLLVIYRPCSAEQIDPAGEERIMSVVTRTGYTDSITGKTLPYRGGARRLLELKKQLNHKYNNRFTYLEYAGLYQNISQQNRRAYNQFFDDKIARYKNVNCDGLSPGSALGFLAGGGVSRKMSDTDLQELKKLYGPSYQTLPAGCMSEQLAFQVASAGLWTDLESLRPVSEFSYTNVPVVLRKIMPTLPVTEQTVFYTKTDNAVTMTLNQGRDLGPARDITALLDVKAEPHDLVVASTSTKIAPDGASVTLTFPLFPNVKAGVKDEPVPSRLRLAIGQMEDGRTPAMRTAVYNRLALIDSKPATKSAAYSMSAPAPAVVIDGAGHGRLTIFVKEEETETKPSGPVMIVSGAEVTSVSRSGSPVKSKAGGWEIGGSGDYTLLLDNLVPGQIVKVTIVDGKDSIASEFARPIFGRLPAVPE